MPNRHTHEQAGMRMFHKLQTVRCGMAQELLMGLAKEKRSEVGDR